VLTKNSIIKKLLIFYINNFVKVSKDKAKKIARIFTHRLYNKHYLFIIINIVDRKFNIESVMQILLASNNN